MAKKGRDINHLAIVKILFPEEILGKILAHQVAGLDVSLLKSAAEIEPGIKQLAQLKSFGATIKRFLEERRLDPLETAAEEFLVLFGELLIHLGFVERLGSFILEIAALLAILPERISHQATNNMMIEKLSQTPHFTVALAFSQMLKVRGAATAMKPKFFDFLEYTMTLLTNEIEEIGEDPLADGDTEITPIRRSKGLNSNRHLRGISAGLSGTVTAQPHAISAVSTSSRKIIKENIKSKSPGDATEIESGDSHLELLKTIKALHDFVSNFAHDVQWSDHQPVLDELMQLLCTILNSKHLHKDVMTAAALTIVTLSCCVFPPPIAVMQLSYLSGIITKLSPISPDQPHTIDRYLIADAGTPAFKTIDISTTSIFARLALLHSVCSSNNPALLITCPELKGESLLFCHCVWQLCDVVSGSVDPFLTSFSIQALTTCVQAQAAHIKNMVSPKHSSDDNDDDRDVCGDSNKTVNKAPIVPVDLLVKSCNRCIDALWIHCEQPMQGISELAILLMEQVINIREMAAHIQQQQSPPQDAHLFTTQHLFASFVSRVLALPNGRKAKFRLLQQVILPRFGPDVLLSMQPALMENIVVATSDTIVGNQAGNLAAMMITKSQLEDRDWWTMPLTKALLDSNLKSREGVTVYMLPPIIQANPVFAEELLECILTAGKSRNDDPCVLRAIVVVLKTMRSVGLPVPGLQFSSSSSVMDENNAVASPPSTSGSTFSEKSVVKIDHLRAALFHVDDSLRLSALELICCHPKLKEPISHEEMSLILEFLSSCFKSSSPNYRKKSMEMLRRLFVRSRVSSNAAEVLMKKRRNLTEEERLQLKGVMDQERGLLLRVCSDIMASLYPGASMERLVYAIELFLVVVDVWVVTQSRCPAAVTTHSLPYTPEQEAENKKILFSEDHLKCLMVALLDGFDSVRKFAYSAIMCFPAPLPGYETVEKSQELIDSASILLQSHRNREADSGAQLLRLAFTKQVKEAGMSLKIFHNDVHHAAAAVAKVGPSSDQTLNFLSGIMDSVEATVEAAKVNFESTFSTSFVHGKLLALRYLIQESPFPRSVASEENVVLAEQWKVLLQRLSDSLLLVTETALKAMYGIAPERVGCKKKPPAQSDKQDAPKDFLTVEEDLKSKVKEMKVNDDDDDDIGNDDGDDADDDDDEEGAEDLGPKEQLLVVSCWLSIKEASLLLSVMASHVPSPTCGFDYLPTEALTAMGDHILHILLSTLHNGAIAKARIALQSLTNRLLCSADPQQKNLPMTWLHMLLSRLEATETTLVVIRRSGQLAYSILALLLAEPSHNPRILLPTAMKRLLETSSDLSLPVRPRVHALNCLRTLFLNTHLAADLATYIPTALYLSLQGFESPSWAIRNSSTMCFATLINRTLGGTSGIATKKTFSPSEFFGRFPKLLSLLLDKVRAAVEHMEASVLGLHPSLQPALLILASLNTSVHDVVSENRDCGWLELLPLVRKCSTSADCYVRGMAARACVSLISKPKSLLEILNLILALPDQVPIRNHNEVHGILEQLRTMWKAHAVVEREVLAGKWRPVLQAYMGKMKLLGAEERVAPMVRRSLLVQGRACIEYMGLIEKNEEVDEEFRQVSVQFKATSLEVSRKNMKISPNALAAGSLLTVAAAIITTSALTTPSTESLDEILSLLQSPIYDVRRSVLKELKKAIREGSSKYWIPTVTAFLLEHVWNEMHLSCQRKAISVITLAITHYDESIPSDRVLGIWNQLISLLKARKSPIALELSGAILKRLQSCCSKETLNSAIREWKFLVEESLEPSQLSDLREGAAKAIVHSNALFWNAEIDVESQTLLGIWLCVLQCLQDDDEIVRTSTSVAVSRRLCTSSSSSALDNGEDEEDIKIPFEVQEARAIELVFHHLSSSFGDNELWIAYMTNILTSANADVKVLISNSEAASKKLFDKDGDNFQEEVLLIIQLCSLHMRKMTRENKKDHHIHAAKKLLTSLELVEKAQKSYWIGGYGDNRDIFQELYRQTLSCHAFYGSPRDEEYNQILLKSIQVSSVLHLNPLLRRVLDVVLRNIQTETNPTPHQENQIFFLLTSRQN